jgi:hypothetical protein
MNATLSHLAGALDFEACGELCQLLTVTSLIRISVWYYLIELYFSSRIEFIFGDYQAEVLCQAEKEKVRKLRW